ncbi:hypothetical protein R6Q57_024769, partial [Mikania cordata]
VIIHMHDNSVECTCMGFTRIGYLCRHIFCVFRFIKVKEILDQYVANRWRLEVLPCRVYGISSRLAVENNAESVLKNEAMECVSECVQQLTRQLEGLSTFVDMMKDLKRQLSCKFNLLVVVLPFNQKVMASIPVRVDLKNIQVRE